MYFDADPDFEPGLERKSGRCVQAVVFELEDQPVFKRKSYDKELFHLGVGSNRLHQGNYKMLLRLTIC